MLQKGASPLLGISYKKIKRTHLKLLYGKIHWKNIFFSIFGFQKWPETEVSSQLVEKCSLLLQYVRKYNENMQESEQDKHQNSLTSPEHIMSRSKSK